MNIYQEPRCYNGSPFHLLLPVLFSPICVCLYRSATDLLLVLAPRTPNGSDDSSRAKGLAHGSGMRLSSF